QHGRLDLDEPLRVEVVTSAAGGAVSQQQVVLQFRAAQVEVAVAEAQVLHRQRLVRSAINGDRKRVRGLDDGQFLSTDFDLTRLQFRVDLAAGAQVHGPLDLDHVLGAEPARRLDDVGRSELRVHRYLDDAGTVAEIDEDEAAEIAAPVNPAYQPYPVIRVVRPQRTREVR